MEKFTMDNNIQNEKEKPRFEKELMIKFAKPKTGKEIQEAFINAANLNVDDATKLQVSKLEGGGAQGQNIISLCAYIQHEKKGIMGKKWKSESRMSIMTRVEEEKSYDEIQLRIKETDLRADMPYYEQESDYKELESVFDEVADRFKSEIEK